MRLNHPLFEVLLRTAHHCLPLELRQPDCRSLPLLRNLLRLDRRGVLLAKGEVRDRDVVELEVELARAGEEVRPDPLGDCLPRIKRCRSRVGRATAAVPVYHR